MQGKWLRIVGACAALALIAGTIAFWYATLPRYAWLSFGKQERLKVLVCDRGAWVTLTPMVDGKPSGAAERYQNWDAVKDLELIDPDGKTKYTIERVTSHAKAGGPVNFFATVRIAGPVNYRQYCDLVLDATIPRFARVAQFHGPLTAGPVTVNWKLRPGMALTRGSEPSLVQCVIGTFDESRGCWVAVCSHADGNQPSFPADIRPEIRFAYPRGDQPALIEQVVTDEVCCGCIFYVRQPLPDAAGDGPARVTFSFPAWKEGQVAPSTIEVPIQDAAPAAETTAQVDAPGGVEQQ